MEDKQNNQAGASELDDRTGDGCGRIVQLPHIVLASASVRRAAILTAVGWPFEILPANIDETRALGEDAATYVQRLAQTKAEAAARRLPAALIVGADTTVVIGGQILEKPSDDDDARSMLQKLSGRWHQVLTGVAVIRGGNSETRVACETTEVKFAAMSRAEIDWYVSTEEPCDKAGAYAIQGRGSRFIEGIRGDYFNVVGLPVRLLYELLQSASAT